MGGNHSTSPSSTANRNEPENILDDIEKKAEELHKNFELQVKSFLQSKETAEFKKTVKDGAETVLQQLAQLSSTLQQAWNESDSKGKKAIEKAQQKIKEATNELKRTSSLTEQKSAEIRKSMHSAVQSAAESAQRLAQEVTTSVEEANKKFTPEIKSAYEDFLKKVEEIQSKINDAASKK